MRNRIRDFGVYLGLAMGSLVAVHSAELIVQRSDDGLVFELAGAEARGPWVLQHSQDAREWSDLLFLEAEAAGRAVPGVNLHWRAVPESAAREGYFRASLAEGASSVYREYLTQRALWRRANVSRYEYALQQNFGMVFWAGSIRVSGAEVDSFQVTEQIPEFFEITDVPTVDSLFDRIADAIARQAVQVDIEWNSEFGYPESGFIDLDRRIADEEQGWSVRGFTPLP